MNIHLYIYKLRIVLTNVRIKSWTLFTYVNNEFTGIFSKPCSQLDFILTHKYHFYFYIQTKVLNLQIEIHNLSCRNGTEKRQTTRYCYNGSGSSRITYNGSHTHRQNELCKKNHTADYSNICS